MAAHDGSFRYEAKESAPHNSLDVTQQGQLDIVGCKRHEFLAFIKSRYVLFNNKLWRRVVLNVLVEFTNVGYFGFTFHIAQ